MGLMAEFVIPRPWINIDSEENIKQDQFTLFRLPLAANFPLESHLVGFLGQRVTTWSPLTGKPISHLILLKGGKLGVLG
jgi:hypothetical protein